MKPQVRHRRDSRIEKLQEMANHSHLVQAVVEKEVQQLKRGAADDH